MRFLRSVFEVGESHRMFQDDVMRWKCFAPHPFWDGSRGYALRYKGEIAAFGCLVPCRFLTGSKTVPSCNVIDWAASKAVPGAGILLYRHIQGLTGTMINIGGTEDARHVLPKIGFQERAEIHHYTHVVAPWQHFRNTGHRDWKSPLRLARDYRELARSPQPSGSLTAQRVQRLDGLFPESSGPLICARTAGLIDYFLTCPAAGMEAYVLARGSEQIGYFLLSRIGSQCRVADLWIRSATPQDWTDAYAAATAAAKGDGAVELTVAASLPLQMKALEHAGYRQTHTEPVFVLDPESQFGDRHNFALGLLENDGFYWSTTGM